MLDTGLDTNNYFSALWHYTLCEESSRIIIEQSHVVLSSHLSVLPNRVMIVN